MKELVSREVYCTSADTETRIVLKRMIEKRLSCALINDANRKIVGIVTERDILRKLSTLALDSKLSKPVRTIMSPSVLFVREAFMWDDIKKLHREKKVRHFPVVSGNNPQPTTEELVGIVTITDIARMLLLGDE
jgi:CBS domain-containing protein